MKIIIKRNRMLLVVLVLSMTMAMCLTGCGEEVNGVLQIQKVKNISFDGDTKLPYEIKYYGNATDAYNNPLPIYVKDTNSGRYIHFSFTDERFSVDEVVKGVIIEADEDAYGTDAINQVGNIQTFCLFISSNLEEITTVVYEIDFYDSDEKKYKSSYMAFRVIPE